MKLLKLGLLTLLKLGSGRNRGSGSCVVIIDNEDVLPGELLKCLARVKWSEIAPLKKNQDETLIGTSNKPVLLKLVFSAQNPICVPESPIGKSNVIKSGFSIPASAVQGAILHRINDISEEVATACFNNDNFRSWPLNPTCDEDTLSLRVSCTHKMSKLKINDSNYHFEDEIIRPYEWDKIPSKSPMMSCDGVLFYNGNKVKFWKSSNMTRVITAHGVHNGVDQKRNLYTVEALSPILFSGIISMPETAAELLEKSLKVDPFIQLGKSRSVRGGGEIKAERIIFDDLSIMNDDAGNVFIVQSPIHVPQDIVNKSVSEIIKILVEAAGFGEVEKASGSLATQFGWNRTINKDFLRGETVIKPGAVFKLKSLPENLFDKLLKGIGDGRKRGFGAVLPHPGIAEVLYYEEPGQRKIKAGKKFGEEGFKLWEEAKDSMLSTSQISRIRELTIIDPRKAVEYLNRQRDERPVGIWNQWKGVIEKIEAGIKSDPANYVKILKICQDLLAADDKEVK